MTIISRPYDIIQDYFRVSNFLTENYSGKDEYYNWLQPRWEYMHYPSIDNPNTHRIRLWEANGNICAITHYESRMGVAYFQIKNGYEYLKEEMLSYAVENLYMEKDNMKSLTVFFNTNDTEFVKLADKNGFSKQNDGWSLIYPNNIELPKVSLPHGYRIMSLTEECDAQKLHDVFYRGFDHGEPDKITIDEVLQRQIISPNYNMDLNIFVNTPNNEYAAYSGIWFDKHNKVGYVEPVCTVPKYRRMGFGKAAVLECVRRCRKLGAKRIYVESGLQFYLSIGFQKSFTRDEWIKEW